MPIAIVSNHLELAMPRERHMDGNAKHDRQDARG
jgi:hypothetical protein